jgi:hypothetical protein
LLRGRLTTTALRENNVNTYKDTPTSPPRKGDTIAQPRLRLCPSCGKDLPLSAFDTTATKGRPHPSCRTCMKIRSARRSHRLAGRTSKEWTIPEIERLFYELDRAPTPGRTDTRAEILAFWGVDEGFIYEWQQRLARPRPEAPVPAAWQVTSLMRSAGPLDADVLRGLEFLAELGNRLRMIEQLVERVDRKTQRLDHIDQQLRALGRMIEALGGRLAALEVRQATIERAIQRASRGN